MKFRFNHKNEDIFKLLVQIIFGGFGPKSTYSPKIIMKKMLVTGAAGLLGSRMVNLTSKYFEVIATYNKYNPDFKPSIQLGITDKKQVTEVMRKTRPDVIIHAAALTDVDYCEIDKKLAWKINAEGTKNIVNIAKSINAKMVFISSDYVFDGSNGPYKEDDKTNPISYYGKTKLEGEKIVSDCENSLIIRTTVLFGAHKPNFVTWVIEKLKMGGRICIVDDQYGTPTFVNNLADIILKLIKMDKNGIYNVAGKDYINRYEFALKIADVFELDKSLIDRISTEKLKQKAPRPLKGGLTTDKLENETNVKIYTILEALNEMKNNWGVKNESR